MLNEIIKWSATTIVILGSFINALGYQLEGVLILIVGAILWLWIGIRWKEMSMIITNLAVIVVSVVGMAIPKILPVVKAYLG